MFRLSNNVFFRNIHTLPKKKMGYHRSRFVIPPRKTDIMSKLDKSDEWGVTKWVMITIVSVGTTFAYYLTLPNFDRNVHDYCDCYDYCHGSGYVKSQKGAVFNHEGYKCDCKCHSF